MDERNAAIAPVRVQERERWALDKDIQLVHRGDVMSLTCVAEGQKAEKERRVGILLIDFFQETRVVEFE